MFLNNKKKLLFAKPSNHKQSTVECLKNTKNAVEIVTTKKMSKISENMTKILPSESLSN